MIPEFRTVRWLEIQKVTLTRFPYMFVTDMSGDCRATETRQSLSNHWPFTTLKEGKVNTLPLCSLPQFAGRLSLLLSFVRAAGCLSHAAGRLDRRISGVVPYPQAEPAGATANRYHRPASPTHDHDQRATSSSPSRRCPR